MITLDKKILASLSTLLLVACSGGDSTKTDFTADSDGHKKLSGQVVKGPIDGATLSLRPVNPFTGFIDEQQAPVAVATTDASGNFTFEIDGLTGPGVLQTSGGKFIDESDANFDGGERRHVVLTEDEGLSVYIPDDVTVVSVTMLTEIIGRRAVKLAETTNASLGNAFDAVRVLTLQALGYDPIVTTAVNPLNPGANASILEKQYALAIGGLAYVTHEVAIRAGLSQMTAEVINAVIVDLSDGSLDGKEGEQPIIINATEMADVDLAAAIKRFRSNNNSHYQDITPRIPDQEILKGTPVLFNAQPQAVVLTDANFTVTVGQRLNINSLLDLSDDETSAADLKLVLVEHPLVGFVTGDDDQTPLSPSDPPQSTLDFNLPQSATEQEVPLHLAVADSDQGATRFDVVLLVNHPPVAQPDVFFVDQDTGPHIFDVLANDDDIDQDTLSISAVTNVVGGSASIVAGVNPKVTNVIGVNPKATKVVGGSASALDGVNSNQIQFTVDEGFSGLASFDYQISDGHAAVTASVEVNVTPSNAPPVAAPDTAVAVEGQSLQINVLNNDVDPDADELTVVSVTTPTNGSATISSDSFSVIYTPQTGFIGEDQFSYTVSDQQGGSDDAVVDVFVSPANSPPVAQDDAVAAIAGETVPIFVLDNDSDPDGDTLTVVVVATPSNGTASIDQTGEVVLYTPDPDFSGQEQFTYTVGDGAENGEVVANISVDVVINSAPLAVPDTAATQQDQPVSILVLENDSDAEQQELFVVDVSDGQNGTVSIDAGDKTVTYTPLTDFTGTDQFTYTVTDGHPGGDATTTVEVSVNLPNTPPVANNDSAKTAPGQKMQMFVLKNDSDADHDRLTVIAVSEPSSGVATVTIDGYGSQITYIPDATFEGLDSFDYTVSDSHVGGESVASVSINVTSENANPVAEADSARTRVGQQADIFVLQNDSDEDGDFLVVSQIMSPPTNGSASLSQSGEFVSYTPNQSFNGSDQFEYEVVDGAGGQATAIVSITVTDVNAPPVANSDAARAHTNLPAEIYVLDNDSDPDGDPLTITAAATPSAGVSSIEGDYIAYSPNSDFEGEDTFSYTIDDEQGGSNASDITVTVSSTNAQPIAEVDFVVTAPGQAIDIFVLDNDHDPEGDLLSVVDFLPPSSGNSVEINGTGAFVTYTPAETFEGEDLFYYLVDDGFGGMSDAPVKVLVGTFNTPPSAQGDTGATTQGEPIDLFVLENDSDPEGDFFFITNVTQGSNGGTVEIGSAGSFVTYTAATDFIGTDEFTYFIEDEAGGQASATVTVEVSSGG